MKTKREEFLNQFDQDDYDIRKDMAEKLDEVISEYAREVEAWLPYPENKPENGQPYLITTKLPKASGGYIYSVKADFYQLNGFVHNEQRIIAFRELPAPYQERGEIK